MSNDSHLSSPFTPSDADLRDFPYMPIDIARLFGSQFHARSSDAEWRAGVTLWLKSFHQVPAASLPDEEIALARLAELGRDVRAWRKLRAGALHGWVKASDGRLYHRVVAVKALEAWIEKLTQRRLSAAGNAKRYKLEFDAAPFDIEIGRALLLLSNLDPQSRALRKRPPGRAPAGSPADALTGVPPRSQEKGREEKVYPSQDQRKSEEAKRVGSAHGATLALVGGTASDDDEPFVEAAS
jgi:hypothetical protein